MLITSYAFKTTVANSQSLVFSLQNNSLLEKRHADHHFSVQMFEFQQFRTSSESKALSARRSHNRTLRHPCLFINGYDVN